ncbi:histone transcription regulator slm9 [Penicillium bovifimosum]|uniref:Histone transcription regulator slm9 n=1 Tax=Penicillium bovifimosum TaxID=126998 RepID=A0A9W9LB57_9EURO|nr:histone transcription regulator slm9 [Penicillium bovifimosum]KAJ5145448.1 histone transcription regulator slm9 [Penicillium bovifimosum]
MHIIKPVWLTHGGERKDFEVYSCDVSPDGKRLVTAAGGELNPSSFAPEGLQKMPALFRGNVTDTMNFDTQMDMCESGQRRPFTAPELLNSRASQSNWPP